MLDYYLIYSMPGVAYLQLLDGFVSLCVFCPKLWSAFDVEVFDWGTLGEEIFGCSALIVGIPAIFLGTLNVEIFDRSVLGMGSVVVDCSWDVCDVLISWDLLSVMIRVVTWLFFGTSEFLHTTCIITATINQGW